MQIKHFFNSKTHTISFSIQLAEDETPAIYNDTRKSAQLRNTHFRMLLPDKIDGFECLHPDQWALIILLTVFPFVKSDLRLSFAVSSTFATAYNCSGKHIFPIDPTLEPYGGSNRPALRPSVAFNGRVHSFTTAAILGTSSSLIALNHWDSIVGERSSPYPQDALFYALDNLEEKGYDVHVVKTDIQSLYEPYGFAHPLTSTVGAILLSDVLGLDSVHVGCHMDELATYGKCTARRTKQHVHTSSAAAGSYQLDTQQRTKVNYISFKHHQLQLDASDSVSVESTLFFWREMFKTVRMRIDFPLCGATDAVLVKLLAEHQLWSTMHYCLYSRPTTKCGVCVECFYYDSLYQSVMRHKPVFEKIWNVCTTAYPEATTSIYNLKIPSRWHMFWVEHITRVDILPQEKVFKKLALYSREYHTHKYTIHNVDHIIQNEFQNKVKHGIRRLISVLAK